MKKRKTVAESAGIDGPAVLCCTAATSNPTTAAAQRTGRLEIAPADTGAGR